MACEVTRDKILDFGNMLVLTMSAARIVKPKSSRKKKDGSPITSDDILTGALFVDLIRNELPGVPFVFEESEDLYGVPPVIPTARRFLSVDSIDGTGELLSGGDRWACSAGLVEDGIAKAGVVVQPARERAFAVDNADVFVWDYRELRWLPFQPPPQVPHLIGTDVGGRSPDLYFTQMEKIRRSCSMKIENMPAVHAGISTFLGEISFAWSYTYHHWDLAAVYPLIKAVGGVIERLEGGELPWDSIEMPPVLMASSRESAEKAREMILS